MAGAALAPLVALATAACADEAREGGAQPAAAAPQAQEARVRAFTVPAGALDAALVAFAVQGEVQLLYTADLVANRRTSGVQGRLTPREALERLLSNSGLAATETRPGVFILRNEDRAGLDDPLSPAVRIDDVVVTGSLIRGPGETPSPVIVLSRDDLDRQGHATVADALTALPQAFAGSATPTTLLSQADASGSNISVATGVNLRGLGEDSTLVLVNGRRLAGTGLRGEFADLSTLPDAAVERVDVLLDGASALYGSDAVGGVVNVILRRGYDGQESRLRLSAARGGAEDVMVSHLLGRRWENGSAMLSFEHQDKQALSASDRRFTATSDLRPFGGRDHRTFYSAPGTIVRFNPAAGAYTPLFAIRPGADGIAHSPADFAAGEANLANRRQGVDLLPAQTRNTLYARVDQSLSSWLKLSADLRFSRREFDYATIAPISILTVTAANPLFVSPTGAASHQIAYNFERELGATRTQGSSRSLGLTAGAEVDLPRAWMLDVYGAYAEELGRGGQYGLTNSTFISEALGSTPDNPATAYSAARDGYLNLFGSGQANGASVLDFIGSGFDWSQSRSRIGSLNVLVDGDLLTLPAGPVKLAFGANARREEFSRRSETLRSGLTPSASVGDLQTREIAALFVEARVPLVSEGFARPGLERLDLTLAARTERYDDFGTTTNPKVGLVWGLFGPLKARASWGTSFRAPSLPEVYERVAMAPASLSSPAGTRLALLTTGGNTNLQPETAETFSLGLELNQREGLRFSASYFDIRFEDRIARPAVQNLATTLFDPSLAPFVTAVNPSNPADLARVQALISDPRYLAPGLYPASAFALLVDGRWVNTGEVRVRGLDLSAGYAFTHGDHRFDLSLSAAHLFEYSRLQTPIAAREDLLDTIGFPTDLRLQAAAAWSWRDWSGRFGLSHTDDYRAGSGGRIDAWTTFDGQVRWSPETLFGAGAITVAVTVQNLMDEDPPFYDNPVGVGFDPAGASPIGRTVALQLIKRW